MIKKLTKLKSTYRRFSIWESVTLFFLPAFVWSLPISSAHAQVTVGFGEVTGLPGEVVQIPINVSSLTGQGILAYQLVIAYDPYVIDITGYNVGGTISTNATMAGNAIGPGEYSVGGGTFFIPFEGGGVLVKLTAVLQNPETTALTWQKAEFTGLGGGVPVNAINGQLTVIGTPANRPPEISSTPATEARQNQTYTYNITATDPNPDPLSINAVNIPGWLNHTDTGNGNATLSGIPGANDVGTHPVVIEVDDGNGGTDRQQYTITVNSAAPAFTSVPGTNAAPNQLYTYTAVASDPFNDPIHFGASSLPNWLGIVDNGDGTATVSGTPLGGDEGQHEVGILIIDVGGVLSEQTFTITVSGQVNNSYPYFTNTPETSGYVGQPYTYRSSFVDPDANVLNITVPTLPVWMNVQIDVVKQVVSLSGTPGVGEAGRHDVVIQIDDSQGGITHQIFDVTVAGPMVNTAPTFTSSPISVIMQGEAYTYTTVSSDPNGDPVTLTAPTLPPWLAFVDNSNGTATISGTPGAADAGRHNVVLQASDGGNVAKQAFTITVGTNDPPAFTSTPVTQADEQLPYLYTAIASDPNGDPLTIVAPTLPVWITFTDNGDGTASLTGTPDTGDVGSHNVTLEVEDGRGGMDTQTFTIDVVANQPPTFNSTPGTDAGVNRPYSYLAETSDPDSDALTISAPTVPAWLAFSDNGDGTASLQGTPGITDVGPNNVELNVDDGRGGSDQQAFTIDVVANNPPAFDSTPGTDASVDRIYSYLASASDADGDALTFTAPTLPAWLTFTDNGDGTALLTGTPGQTHTGQHDAVLLANDGRGGAGRQAFTIDVVSNTSPAFASTPLTQASENRPYAYTAIADDPDGDPLTFGAPSIPDWLALTDNGDGSATLAGTPDENDVGQHDVALEVSDGRGGTDQQTFTVDVAANAIPAFTSTPLTQAEQNRPYTYSAAANDPDGDQLTFSAPTRPPWLTFTDNGGGTASLTGTPSENDLGQHDVVLEVNDGFGGTDRQSFTITVSTNTSPVFTSTPVTDAIPDQSYLYNVSADDPDGDPLTLTAPTLPLWLSFTDNGDGFALLTGIPSQNDAGQHNVLLEVSDGRGGNDQQAFTVTVSTNSAPVAADDSAVTDEDTFVDIDVLDNDSDPDGDTMTISDVTMAAHGATELVQMGTIIRYTPATDYNGSDTFTYSIQDSRGEEDTGSVTITIVPVNDPPVFQSPVFVSPEDGASVFIGGGPGESPILPATPFTIDWNDALDVDGPAIIYMWQLNDQVDFETSCCLTDVSTGSISSFTTDYGSIASIIDQNRVSIHKTDTYYHRVVASDGSAIVTSPVASLLLTRGTFVGTESGGILPVVFSLSSNYPNPFNAQTSLLIDLPEPALVTVTVFDLTGRQILVLPEQALQPGQRQAVSIEAGNWPSGIYIYQVVAQTPSETFKQSGTMTLLR